jgi:hypothetical protein
MNERQRYLSYLLRIWQTSDEAEQIWRASLEIPGTGERQGFASLEDLFDFLRTQTKPPNEQDFHVGGDHTLIWKT